MLTVILRLAQNNSKTAPKFTIYYTKAVVGLLKMSKVIVSQI